MKSRTGFTVIALSLACLSSGADGARINAEMRAAIQAGKSVYVLPYGRLDVSDQTPWVPPGTKNFTVRGHPRGTTLYVPTPRNRLFEVGDYMDNMGLPSTPIAPVAEGDRLVKTQVPTGYYALVDDHRIVNRYGSGGTLNRGEIIKLGSMSRRGASNIEGAGAGRDYNVSPRLVHLGSKLAQNIRLENIKFDGAGSQNMLFVGLVDGIELANLEFTNYKQVACNLYFVRNATVYNCRVGYANPGVGQGYGIVVTRSRFVRILNSELSSPAAVRFHSGSMDGLVQDCVLNAGGDAVNSHGYDERRITCRRLIGNSAITLGNDAWLAGGRGHLVEDCNLSSIWLGPNAKDVVVRRSHFVANGNDSNSGSIMFSTMYPDWVHVNAWPRGGRPSGIRVEDCSFEKLRLAIQPTMWYDADVEFVRCKFTATATDWGNVIKFNGHAQGQLTFDRCEFVSHNAREMWDIRTGETLGLALRVTNSTFRELSPWGNTAIIIRDPFVGSLIHGGNSFYSLAPPHQLQFLATEAPIPDVQQGPNFTGN